MENMIPRVIHYCWFGGNPLPESAKKCIASWKKFFPGYEIKEWNETNYDVKKIPYISQAYESKKYAFVSDYARFDILYHEGGIYFDTDVEVLKSFDDILKNGAFMGCEIDAALPLKTEQIYSTNKNYGMVNPGLGIAASPGLHIYREILDFYNIQSFLNLDGSLNTETVVTKTTNVLKQHGFKDIKGIQQIEGITIYPKEYFNPKDSKTGRIIITENTHSIHWYAMTWLSPGKRLRKKILDPFHQILGPSCFRWIRKIFSGYKESDI